MIPKRIAILQSNYIPWRGYFDIIGLVDEFVVYDVAQYTKNDWRNRNRIRTVQGVQWLTIPVITSGRFGQSIAQAEVVGGEWTARHRKALSQAYAHAPFLEMYAARLEATYDACASLTMLSAVNRLWIDTLVELLGIGTTITDATAYAFSGDRNARLLSLCQSAGATTYLTGPSARGYLAVDAFERAGITVEFMDYSGYLPYPQVHGGYVPDVSVIDLLLNVGPSARQYLQCGAGR